MVVITKPVRPLNVTIAAGLVVLSGVLLIVSSIWTAATIEEDLSETEIVFEEAETFFRILTASVALLGIPTLLTAQGILQLRGWAWWVTSLSQRLDSGLYRNRLAGPGDAA